MHRHYLTIGATLAILTAAFAWVGGALSSGRLSGGDIADSIESANGTQAEGYRRAHAKGICVTGHFDSSGAGAEVSTAFALQPSVTSAVTGRFSLAGGNPLASDGRNVFHAIGLSLVGPGGRTWRMAMDHTPIFPVATPEQFVQLVRGSTPDPKTGKPDPAAMAALTAAVPSVAAFGEFMKTWPLPDSFANATYYSISAFRMTDAAGTTRAVRWSLEPEDPLGALDKATLAELPKDALFDELPQRLARGPIRWHLKITLANPEDPTNDATRRWPDDRRSIDAGTLVLERSNPEAEGGCRDINFDPTILPPGIAISDDPLLAARSAAYAASHRRRELEGAQPVAATPDGAAR